MFFRKRTRKKKRRNQREKKENEKGKKKKTGIVTERKNGNGKENEKERGRENVKKENAEKRIGTEIVTNATETVIGIEIGIGRKREKRIGILSVTETRNVNMMKRKRWTEDGGKENRGRRMRLIKR